VHDTGAVLGSGSQPPHQFRTRNDLIKTPTNATESKRKHSKINEADHYPVAHNGLGCRFESCRATNQINRPAESSERLDRATPPGAKYHSAACRSSADVSPASASATRDGRKARPSQRDSRSR